jgi:hypothetical protein
VQGQTLMQPCAPAPVAPIDGQHAELADIKSQYPRFYAVSARNTPAP